MSVDAILPAPKTAPATPVPSATAPPAVPGVTAPPAAPPEAPLPAGGLPLLERLLRDRKRITEAILRGSAPARLTTGLVAIAALGAATYGAAVGFVGGPLQAVSTAIKLPIVLLGAAAISLPVLHVSCALVGAETRWSQLRDLVLQALSTATITMAGLAPLVTIGWLSCGVNAEDWYVYRRVVLGAVFVGGIGGLVGAGRLLRSVPLTAAAPWTIAFGLSAMQLSWLLRPLVGNPDSRFVVLRPLESNVVTEVLTALAAVLS
jgi:hypothetical protein